MLNRNDERNELKKMILLCVAAASCVLLMFLAFIYMRDDASHKKVVPVMQEKEIDMQEEETVEYGKSNTVSEDLDFWDMYREGSNSDETEEENEDDAPTKKFNSDSSKTKESPFSKKDKNQQDNAGDSSMNNDSGNSSENANDGNHITVTAEDGTSASYEIDNDIPKNEYVFKNNLALTNKGYVYDDGDRVAKIGVDLSKYQGTVDFGKLKDSGIDFAMLRIGARGYSKGEITLDDKFVEYATLAKTSGMPIGIYIYSMAVNDVEAVEEANFAVGACNNYGVTYPIAIDMETVTNEDYRSKNLSNRERTKIAKTFCDTVKGYGYTPIIYANRDFLIEKLDLEELVDYDVWLSDPVAENINLKKEDTDQDNSSSSSSSSERKEEHKEMEDMETLSSDYPYWYSMWQYTQSAKIDGINGSVDMNLSFIDYDKR